VKELLEGDSNTKYFHLVTNGKHRKTHIFQLQNEGQIIVGDEALRKHITSYYKNLFGLPTRNMVMDESHIDDIPQASELENESLIEKFTEKEVKEAIFQIEHNKAAGPDGFSIEFYQTFWELIKKDLMALFEDFHKGELPLYSLNFGTIILLPKSMEAYRIQQYRPICLLNVSFKIFTKETTNRLTGIAQKVISPEQTTFFPEKYNGRDGGLT
jgi:hypothetical protein